MPTPFNRRLDSKALQVKASYLNLVKTQSAAVTAYQNYVASFSSSHR